MRTLPALRGRKPSVDWPTASPPEEGFDPAALAALADSLAVRNTKTLIVARHGRLVFEWYAPDFTENRRHFTAATAKGVSAMPTLIAAAQDGLLSLDDHVADWVPEWRADPRHAQITLLDLAFHRSGMENVGFDAGQAGELPDWKQRYYDHPDERFRLALDSAALLFDAGTRYAYSGVGYYVLSYVVSRALQNRSPASDIPSFVAAEVYGPLGLPRSAWSLGYGRSDTVGGIALTHFGSGGQMTARAAARVGQLMLQHGCWDGTPLLDPELVDLLLGRGAVTPIQDEQKPRSEPVSLGGWWSNQNGVWPSAPREAYAAVGAQHELTFVDPVHDIVAVRMGGDMRRDGATSEASSGAALEHFFFAPLYAALEDGAASGEAPAVAGWPRGTSGGDASCADEAAWGGRRSASRRRRGPPQSAAAERTAKR